MPFLFKLEKDYAQTRQWGYFCAVVISAHIPFFGRALDLFAVDLGTFFWAAWQEVAGLSVLARGIDYGW